MQARSTGEVCGISLAFPGALKQQQQKESILVGPSGRPRPRKCLVGASRVSPRCVLVCGRRCIGPVGQPEAETVVPRQGGRVTLDSPGSTKVGWSVKPRRESPLAVGGRRRVLSLPKRCLFAPEVEAVVRPWAGNTTRDSPAPTDVGKVKAQGRWLATLRVFLKCGPGQPVEQAPGNLDSVSASFHLCVSCWSACVLLGMGRKDSICAGRAKSR